MNKPLIFISSAYNTYSGYGARSRDLIKELINSDKYIIKLIPQRWGNTAWGFCEKNKEWSFLLNYQISQEDINVKPDVWVQITIPNEFQNPGRINIGITAGIESDVCAPEWIEGLNKMDINLVSSNHSKEVFNKTRYIKNLPNGDKVNIFNEKPLEVLFEGLDPTKYHPTEDSKFDLNMVEEDFCFLVVGQWLQGEIGEDRKNIGLTVKTFIDSFKNTTNPPGLVLKVSIGNNSKMNKYSISRKVEDIKKLFKPSDKLPNIYLINSDLTDHEMNELYNHDKIKSLVSLTKGEGFGRPLLEFSFVGKPIISSNWSGQKDFLMDENILSLKGELKPISESSINQWIVNGGRWFNVDEDGARNAYKVVYNNYKKYCVKANALRERNISTFNVEKMGKKLINIIEEQLKDKPKFIELNLKK